MNAAENLAAAALLAEAAALTIGLTEQARLRGLTAATDTYGLPDKAAHLIRKLRVMPDWQRDDVRGLDA